MPKKRPSTSRQFFNELLARCQGEELYGEDPVSKAFIRLYEEPGRDWNMDAWEKAHMERVR